MTSRRSFLAAASAAVFGTTAVASDAADSTPATNQPLGSIENDSNPLDGDTRQPDRGVSTSGTDNLAGSGEMEFDINIYATEKLINPTYSNYLEKKIPIREYAATTLRTAYNDLVHASDRITGINVTTIDETYEQGDPDTIVHEFRSFEDWLDGRDDRAADSNILLSHYKGGGIGYAPHCHLDGECSSTIDADVAVARSVEWYYAPFLDLPIDRTLRNRTVGEPVDPDGDGRFEDVNANGKTTFLDVVKLLYSDSVRYPELYDFDGDGKVGFLDVVELLHTIGDGGQSNYSTPLSLEFNGYAFANQVIIHETAHNAGLQHDMGSAWVDAKNRVHITPMLSTYYLSDEPPNPGTENRVGDLIPEREGRPVVFENRFSEAVRSNDDWFYDETN